jgi:serine/threonine-protein kinase
MSADALHNLCRADPVWADRYEGWTELGHGGSATVVRTHGRALGEDLALKVFPHLSRDEWTRFRQEVSTAQKLTSPFIVRTYSPFPRGTFAWIELELIEGDTLRQQLDRRAAEGRRFTRDEVVAVGAAVASALATAHEAGVTHRDVKPANILLPRGGRPAAKLGDFGISRLAGAARLTSTGLLVGTPQFAAPEVAAGALAEPPADVYSFALCLYLMISGGRPPFVVEDETSPTHWLRAHTHARPRPITDFDASVPAPLAALLDRALAKEPERRPTAAEAAAVLHALAAGEEKLAATAPRSRPPRALLASATFASLAAAAALAVWTDGGGAAAVRSDPPAQAARVRDDAGPAMIPATLPPAPAPPRTLAAASATPRPSAPPAAAPAPPVALPDAAAATAPAAPEASAVPPLLPTPEPAPATPEPAATPSPAPVRTEERAAPATAGGRLHLEGLLSARAVTVNRHEGLPGQREMVLVDALHGEEWIWFRFKLEGGASLRIARVSWERGEIGSYVQEPSGADLRVIVQVPRAAVTRSARLVLEVEGGPAYTFALGSRSLGRFLRELFQ